MNKQYLKTVFPQMDDIKDESIKKGVINTFLRAAEQGNWDTLDNIPFTLLLDTNITFAEHTKAVTDMAIKVADTMKEFVPITMDYIIAGGLLHDVGKLLEYTKEKGTVTKSEHGNLLRHPVSGAIIAAQEGLPPEVLHIIVAHSKEGEAVTRRPEAIIIHHCDFIHFENLREHAP
ncbi:MAG: HDIG domain-containing protein [Candidatus Methanofastidiosia archaeon]|jgi:putative nucleotidyltransferase with HDIG domain